MKHALAARELLDKAWPCRPLDNLAHGFKVAGNKPDKKQATMREDDGWLRLPMETLHYTS